MATQDFALVTNRREQRVGFGRFFDMVRGFVFGKSRAYVQAESDRAQYSSLDAITVGSIKTALNEARLGNMAPLGDLYDLMPASNPVVHGILRQLKAGVRRVPIQVAAVSDEPLAVEIADDVRNQMTDPDTPIDEAVDNIVECRLRGGGLAEIMWRKTPAGEWYWTGCELVPQQRIRFDRHSGEIALAPTRFDYGGALASSFPRGTFLVVTPDANIPDFSQRGVLRSCLTDWFAMQNVADWFQRDLEFTGSPFVIATYDTDEEGAILDDALERMGSNGKLSIRKGSEFKLLERTNPGGSFGVPHHEFETTRVARVAIAVLGATQTVSVDPNAGSQSTANVMNGIRDDVLAAYWQLILSTLRRDLVMTYVGLNYGLEKIDLTPQLQVDLAPSIDTLAVLNAFEKGAQLGCPVEKSHLYKSVKWPQPEGIAPGELITAGTGVPVSIPPQPATVPAQPRRIA